MADISTIVGVDGSSYTIKDATARGLLNGHSVGKDVPANAAFTDTTYESKQAASGGTDLSLVTTGEKYVWNEKLDSNFGSSNAGKFLAINSDGDVGLVSITSAGGVSF